MRKLIAIFLFAALFVSVLHESCAVQSLGLYQTRKDDASSTSLDTIAWSYVSKGHLHVQIVFGEQETIKIDTNSAGANQFFLELTRKDYEKIFESSENFSGMVINDSIWNRVLTAESFAGKRKIAIVFENSIDAEITDVFKRGRLEIEFAKEQINSIKMKVEKKRMLNFGGFSTIFAGEANNLQRSRKGLALCDDDEIGRLETLAAIDAALANKTSKGFKDAIEYESKTQHQNF